MKSIHERVRAAQEKREREAKKTAARSPEQIALNRRMGALAAADVRIEKGIDRALTTGIARTKREQRALDYENFID